MNNYNWRWFRAGRMAQVKFENGEDIANLAALDKKHWLAISMPVKSVRFDRRMLELMDTDGDGRIRTPEVIAAVEFLKSKGVDLNTLFSPSEADKSALEDVLARQADLAKAEPSDDDKKAIAAWEKAGQAKEVLPFGAATADADAALAAVESVVEQYFIPAEDAPLVIEEPEKPLPLKSGINARHADAIAAFAEKCVKPVLGDVDSIDRAGWKKVKAALAPYRAWTTSKPVANAGLKDALVEEERVLRYKLHLLEFLENFVNMKRLYDGNGLAVFQTGVLRIDAKEMNLCFDVESEAAHSALAGKSGCCVIYLKISRPAEGASRSICAVVTAGAVAQLYAGRNGVFYDRDGKDWEAVITKVVENQVSLVEAFWAPWRKLGEGVSGMVKKFFGDKQKASEKVVETSAQSAQASGAAMASSVAAIGIGIGMVGAAMASLMAVVSSMNATRLAISLVALVLVVSLPSVVLTWFKLRKRDIGTILNASGWAVNRPMYFSMKRARRFTICASNPLFWRCVIAVVLVAALTVGGILAYKHCKCRKNAESAKQEQQAETTPTPTTATPTTPAPATTAPTATTPATTPTTPPQGT